MNTPRTHTAAVWIQLKPVLAKGEPGRESDTGKVKYGNGFSTWADLPYDSESDVKGTPRTMHPTRGTPVYAVPNTVTITGISDPTGSNPITLSRVADVNGYPSWELDDWVLAHNSDNDWILGKNTELDYYATKESTSRNPVGLTSWTVIEGTGSPSIAGTDYAGATTAPAGKELFDDDFRYLATTDISTSSTSGWVKSAIDPL